MTCCGDATIIGQVKPNSSAPDPAMLASETFSISGLHCAGCISKVERRVAALGGDTSARVNLTRQTVTVRAPADGFDVTPALAAIRDLGYVVRPLAEAPETDETGRELMRSLAVSGFAAMNVMLLSVSVWAGADGETERFLTWVSALIALPALLYSARPFVRSAFKALSARTLNMDVPIAIAITLAALMSLVKTINGEGETYFDAAVTLTFFLLAGRLVAHSTRERARNSIRGLASLTAPLARRVMQDGTVRVVSVKSVRPGMVLELAAGDRVPVDSRVDGYAGTFDASLVTGESQSVTIGAGHEVGAGLLALSGPVRLTALRDADDSLVARMRSLQEAAESMRPHLSRIADKAARIYAPVVHLTALFTMIGWMIAGASFGDALTIAIAVLIITCPCALALAVPIVQAAAMDVMFRRGMLVKDGAVLERLRAVTSVVFDKTGTLTGPRLRADAALDDDALADAAALARHSTHPVARALEAEALRRELELPLATGVKELPGQGVVGMVRGREASIGRPTSIPSDAAENVPAANANVLLRAGLPPVILPIEDTVREGADQLIEGFKERGMTPAIISGDTEAKVAEVAATLGVSDWTANAKPAEKLALMQQRADAGERVLMIGDGLNDGAALAAAHASIAMADATDLARASADVVLTSGHIGDVAGAMVLARKAHSLTVQNLVLAGIYNCIAIPIAIAGFASPLAAAIGMSASSVVVIANAQRIRAG